MHEEALYKLIYENSETIDVKDKEQLYHFTTSFMARQLGIPRNVASAALNRLYTTGALIKIITRPVYYMDRTQLETRYHVNITSTVFYSVEQLWELLNHDEGSNDVFSQIIGHDRSLKNQIKQCKAAAYYPGKGLPVLISGPAGTGKSSLARYMHAFCFQKGLIGKNAPFVTFNCADYADNPELLTGILFGYIKGAFTGADEDRIGLLEKADGGVLFLDEAHRLSPNGQEKLFVFMDQGIFNRLGESSSERRSKVRLVFATTEQPKNIFLGTFLRRIPVSIQMPALEERGSDEVVQLICYMLSKQAGILGHDLSVSQNFFEVLLNRRFTGNIGELQNVIQYACAEAFRVSREQKSDGDIYIQFSYLPDYLLNQGNSHMEPKGWQWGIAPERIKITPNFRFENIRRLVEKNNTSSDVQAAYYNIFQSFSISDKKQNSETVMESMENALMMYMDALLGEQKNGGSNIQISMLSSTVNNILDRLFYSNNITLTSNLRNFLTLHFYKRLNFITVESTIPVRLLDNIRSFLLSGYPKVYKSAEELLTLFESNLDVRLCNADFIVVALCIHLGLYQKEAYRTKAFIIAHGYTTATSIANTVNLMLKNCLFESFDILPNITDEETFYRVNSALQDLTVSDSRDLIIMTDMDNLVEHRFSICNDYGGNIALLENITTQIVFEVGKCILQDQSLEEIISYISDRTNSKLKIYHPMRDNQTQAIITTCITGMGTAEKLAILLRDSLSDWVPDMEFIPCDYKSLRVNGIHDNIFKGYKVAMIFGTIDPGIEGIPFVNIGDVMTGDKGKNELQKVLSYVIPPENISQVNDQLIKNFSLQRVVEYLTILNPERVITDVEEFIKRMEHALHKHIDSSMKLLLYVHVSCMIERLVKKTPVTAVFDDQIDFEKKQKRFIKIVEESFSVIEKNYSVRIPVEEVRCIYDIVTMKGGNSLSDREV